MWSLSYCVCSSLKNREEQKFSTEPNTHLDHGGGAGGGGPTIHVFIEDEVDQLDKSILVLVQKDAGDAGVHFFY